MHSAALILVPVLFGVDFGWKALPDDEVEYIIQIEPALLESLENGEPVFSELVPEVRGNVRRFRIQVGNQPLPRESVMRRLRPRTSDVASDASQTKQAKHEAPAIAAPKLDETPPRPAAPDNQGDNRQDSATQPTTISAKKAAVPAAESAQKAAADVSASPAASIGGLSDNWLIAAAVALFVSLGANLYLGWVVTSVRRKYHQLVDSVYARNATPSAM